MSEQHHVGLDVSVKETAICIVDPHGKVVHRATVESHPEVIGRHLIDLGHSYARVGLEAGPLSPWLYAGLVEAGLPAICVETRHMHAALSARINKTDRNDERDFRKETRSNATHTSTTDPGARLYRKADGQKSRLCYLGHALMENRNGLVVNATLTHATGTAEREAGLLMLDRRPRRHRITLGADKLFDVEAFVGDLRARRVSPHIAINGAVSKTGKVRKIALDGRTTRHAGYAVSLRCRSDPVS